MLIAQGNEQRATPVALVAPCRSNLRLPLEMFPPKHPDGSLHPKNRVLLLPRAYFKKEPVMPVHNMSSRRRFAPLVTAALVTILFSSSFALMDARAQSAMNNGAKNPDPSKGFRVPPLPVGSAHVRLQPGMSEKDWHDAYKETGRPKFPRNTVKHVGDTVERN